MTEADKAARQQADELKARLDAIRAEERQRMRRARRIIGAIITLATVVLVAVAVFFAVACRASDSHEDGYSVGTLINVRMEGALWSRPAATLLHTGEMKGDEFALDDGLYAKAMTFADHSARVRVSYANRYVCWAWNYASCNIITGIEPADQQSEPFCTSVTTSNPSRR